MLVVGGVRTKHDEYSAYGNKQTIASMSGRKPSHDGHCHAAIYVCLRRSIGGPCFIQLASSLWCLVVDGMRASTPPSNHRQPPTATHLDLHLRSNPNIRSSATHFHTSLTTPKPAPPRPRWPHSCALACPPQNPATLSPKHRTTQQAVPNNTASTRK